MSALHAFYIGLDIDGIFCPDRFKSPLKEMTASKIAELFQPQANGRYTPLQWKQAAACFLNEESLGIFRTRLLERLEAFIKKYHLPVSIDIIITSNWRNAGSLEELKTEIFNKTAFADRIVAKIPDDKTGVPKVARHVLFADTIRDQPKPLAGYIVLDDNEFGQELHFLDDMEEFVKVDGEKLLTAEDTDKAYAKAKKQLKSSFKIDKNKSTESI